MRTRFKSSRLAVIGLLSMLPVSPAVFGQTITTGDVAGVVKDATGGVVPVATVTLKNTDTNEVRTEVTGSVGQYRISLLKPGDYEVSAQTPGLRSKIEKFSVLVGQVVEMNVVLDVKGTSEVVTVVADTPLLQTENANLETGYNTNQVVNLPMPGGDLTTLAMTVPGVRVSVTGGSGNMNANGIPGSSVLFTLNGSDEMDPYNNLNNSGASNNLLGANEVAEAAVVLNAYSPQYGRMAGGQVNLVGKSGANTFHGNAFYNYNGEFLNGNDFFNNLEGVHRGRSVSQQFGASIGGPVKKNKLFFFQDYEALRYVLPASGVISLPSPALETYALAHVPAASVPLYQDYFSLVNAAPGISRAVPVTNGSGPLQDGNGNMGCGTGTFAGTPTGTGGIFGVNTSCALAFGINDNELNTEGLITSRVDYNVTDKQKLFFRYNYDFGLQATGTSPIAPVFNSVSNQPQDTGSLNYTYIITPTLVNNLVGSAFWYSAIFGVADFNKTTSLIPEEIAIADGGANGGGFTTVGASLPDGRNVGHGQLIDDLSWTKGKHTFKTGASIRFDKVTYTNIAGSSVVGEYTLNDLADFANGTLNFGAAGLGSKFVQSFPKWEAVHFRLWSEDFYVSDEWAVLKNLKLTIGMRFEMDPNPGCTDNCFALLSSPFNSSSYQGSAAIPYNQTIQTGANKAFYNIETVVPEPRFGFAWSPFGNSKTVVRGGIGLFSTTYSASLAGTFASQSPNKFSPSVTFGNVGLSTDPTSSTYAAIASNNAFQSGFTAGDTLAQIKSALGKIAFSLPSFNSAPENYSAPKDVEWNFEVEQQLSPRNIVVLTYVGNHGYNIQESYNLDAYTAASGVTRYGGGFSGLPTAAPDPRFLSVSQYETNGISNYEAGTIQFRHTFAYGLTGQIHYTWSHTLGTVGWYNPYNIATGYGDLNFDNRGQVAADFVWNQPHRFANKAVNSLLGGWTLSGKMYAYTGAPFSVTDSKIPSQINSAGGIGTVLADLVVPSAAFTHCGTSAINTPCMPKTDFATYSTSSGVAAPVQTNWGNIAPDSFRGPGYFDIDTQLTRNFKIRERASMAIGLNAYNVLNHPSFANPSGSISSGSFGEITSAVSPPTSAYGSFQGSTVSGRVIVLTGKFVF